MLQEILLQAKGDSYLPTTVGTITIKNCLKVRIASRSIKEVSPLRRVTLANIGRLDLEVEAFSWGKTPQAQEISSEHGIEIKIINATVPIVPQETFRGNINAIQLSNLKISEVKSLAFANVAKMDAIEISNCYIDRIAPKAFSKFIVNTFAIDGGFINTLPSYTMSSIEVLNKLKFENAHFHMIHSSAFRITEPKIFILRSCKIEIVEGEAFQISTKGQIFIDDNVIDNMHEGAFVGIHLDPRTYASSGTQEFVFENNTLTKFDDYALLLNTSGIKLTIDRIILNIQCSCSEIINWSTKLVKYTSTKTPNSFAKLIWCQKGKVDTVISDYDQKYCTSNSYKVNWAFAVPVVGLIFLLGICSLGFYCYKKRMNRYLNVPTTNNNRHSMLSQTSNIIDNLVIPQRKIYVETELNVLTESVEPIKEYKAPQPVTHTAKS